MVSEIDSFLKQARGAADDLDFHAAQSHVVSALELDANYASAYELLGEIFVEQEQLGNARIAFQRAIELDSSSSKTGFEKYLWMGQLCETSGRDAIVYYKKGIQRLIAVIADLPENEQSLLRSRLASAYSAMAELYMTDLCMEENAETECEKYVTNALLADDKSSEALQTMASMRLSQSRVEDAKTTLRNSMSIWQDQVPGTPQFPTYAARISLIRLLLECEMTEDAQKVLQQLENEGDDNVDLWYMYGWSYYVKGELEQDEDARRELWEDARDCLHRCEKLYKALEHDDAEMQEHASILLGNIHHAGISILPQDDQANGHGEDDEDNETWESDDEMTE